MRSSRSWICCSCSVEGPVSFVVLLPARARHERTCDRRGDHRHEPDPEQHHDRRQELADGSRRHAIAVPDRRHRLHRPPEPEPIDGNPSWSRTVISAAGGDVIAVVTVAITTAALRGLTARSMSRSSRRSRRVSSAITVEFAAASVQSCRQAGLRRGCVRSRRSASVPRHVLSRPLGRLHRPALRAPGLVDLRRQGRRRVLELDLAVARAALPAVDDARLRARLGAAHGVSGLVGWSSRSACSGTSRRTPRAPRKRALREREASSGSRESTMASTRAVDLPVRAQHALVPKPALSASRRAATFSGATNTCTRPRPSAANAQSVSSAERLGRDAPAARRRDDAAADLADPVLARRQHRLAEVRIARAGRRSRGGAARPPGGTPRRTPPRRRRRPPAAAVPSAPRPRPAPARARRRSRPPGRGAATNVVAGERRLGIRDRRVDAAHPTSRGSSADRRHVVRPVRPRSALDAGAPDRIGCRWVAAQP